MIERQRQRERQRERQTERETFFQNTFLECGNDIDSKTIKKPKSNFLRIAILPSLLMSPESKNTTKNREVPVTQC